MVSAGIADVLGTTLDYFRDGMDKKTAENSPMRLVNPPECKVEEISIDDPLKKTETLELIKNYYKINNRRLARHIFNLVRDMGKSNSVMAKK